MLPKRLGIYSKILAISALSTCLTGKAQEKNGWQYDSLGSKSDAAEPDAQRVYEILLKMLDRWNAHDVEGHLEVYWKSPELLVVIDSEQFNGWQQLHDSYVNGYPDLVDHQFSGFQAEGDREYHDEPPEVRRWLEDRSLSLQYKRDLIRILCPAEGLCRPESDMLRDDHGDCFCCRSRSSLHPLGALKTEVLALPPPVRSRWRD
jgi:hypothetical protein